MPERADPHRLFEFRCPVHGFIELNDWEREIVSQPAFQRLRRIRQLAWSDYVYPGAMHSRFEHSLGVMHTATRLYKAIVQNSKDVLKSALAYTDGGLERDLQLVRLAALLHDVGHSPFSHSSEELLPTRTDGTKYDHEDYSEAIIRGEFRDAIENHPLNGNCHFRAEDVAALITGDAITAGQALFWRDLISGQMDADRMDYLLRDSLHAGVHYGRFDLDRLVQTVVAVETGSESEPEGRAGTGEEGAAEDTSSAEADQKATAVRIAVKEGGWHAAEALVVARYFMFTQVYFHKTRVAYDRHLVGALKELLPGGLFPRPAPSDNLSSFLKWDDWVVLGRLANGEGGEHGARLSKRDHYREVYHTPESPSLRDLQDLENLKATLGPLIVAEEHAAKSWYKTGKTDIPIVSETRRGKVSPLSTYSNVVSSLPSSNQILLYAKPEDADLARRKKQEFFRDSV